MQAIEMHVQVTDNHEIRLKLPDDVKQGTVKVIVMYDGEQDNPVIKKRQFGQFKGQIEISDDFDDTLSDEFWIGESS